jgi:Na+/glutamate symporter
MTQIIDFSKLFNLSYLTENPPVGTKFAIFLLVFFALAVIAGIVLSIIAEKKSFPKFYKKFLLRVSDFFIYVPIISIFLVLARMWGISGASKRIDLIVILTIWLIWFIYLVYYRLVILSKLWRIYYDRKRDERYLSNGRRKSS